jgi:hypothetical protein
MTRPSIKRAGGRGRLSATSSATACLLNRGGLPAQLRTRFDAFRLFFIGPDGAAF